MIVLLLALTRAIRPRADPSTPHRPRSHSPWASPKCTTWFDTPSLPSNHLKTKSTLRTHHLRWFPFRARRGRGWSILEGDAPVEHLRRMSRSTRDGKLEERAFARKRKGGSDGSRPSGRRSGGKRGKRKLQRLQDNRIRFNRRIELSYIELRAGIHLPAVNDRKSRADHRLPAALKLAVKRSGR